MSVCSFVLLGPLVSAYSSNDKSLILDSDITIVAGNVKMSFSGPETTLFGGDNLTIIGRVSKAKFLGAAKISNSDPFITKRQLTAILCAYGDGRALACKALANFFTPTSGLVRINDADIGQAAILKAKALIIKHRAAFVGRGYAFGKFAGEPRARPFIRRIGPCRIIMHHKANYTHRTKQPEQGAIDAARQIARHGNSTANSKANRKSACGVPAL